LENQVGQLAKQLSEQQTGSSFSANTQTNPKEYCKAIVTRSDKEVTSGRSEDIAVEDDMNVVTENEENEVVVEYEKKKEEKTVQFAPRSSLAPRKEQGQNSSAGHEGEACEKKEAEPRKKKKGDKGVITIPAQHLPYPHAPSKKENARHYARFMDILKQLQINIPFAEALEQMPRYAKFVKDILTKKKRYVEDETILLDARCSAIIQKTLPRKESNPGRVVLPVTIGGSYIGNVLIDL
jgi:hypothetical protein